MGGWSGGEIGFGVRRVTPQSLPGTLPESHIPEFKHLPVYGLTMQGNYRKEP